MTTKNSRTRNFATIVYPESAPKNWVQKLKDMHIQCFISPLHDKDVNPGGEPKKPHYHVLIMFDTVKNYETQVKPIFEAIGGVGRELVNSTRYYARYLCHLDNPEKAQYDINKVQSLNGADYKAITLLPSDTKQMLRDIFTFIKENDICYLCDLIDLCADHHEEWYEMITTNKAYIIDKYIKSRTYKKEKNPRTSLHETQYKEVLDILFKKVTDEEDQKKLEQLLRILML